MSEAESLTGLPPALLAELGLQPERVSAITLLHARHGHRLYRLRYIQHDTAMSFVLKWFPAAGDVELQSYALLRAHAVPTLPVHGCTAQAILLEDLLASPAWRLAEADDMAHAETGSAVAEWYRHLHAAGKIMTAPTPPPAFLQRESDALDAAGIIEMGRRLHMEGNPVWQLAAEQLAALQAAARRLDETLNYNDFFWSNLALSRQTGPSARAIVFDYHLLGIGLRYSDCRNVVGSLSGAARPAFWEAYGPVDEREALLDAPLATLYSLWVASQRPSLPVWIRDALRRVQEGQLERDLRAALEIV